jgi:hypothetical protein
MASFNYPPLTSPIRRLKFIGPLLSRRFRAEGINTLKDLRDTVNKQSRAQNTRLLHRVLENPRKLQCVGKIKNVDGSYQQYCVRRDNQRAWEAVHRYLIRKGVQRNKLPPRNLPRGGREKCSKYDKCKQNNPIPRRQRNAPYYPIEFIVVAMMYDDQPKTALELYNDLGRNIANRRISATLSANSGNRGERLFTKAGKDPETDRPQYRLKRSVFRDLTGLTIREIVQYIRDE